MIYYWSGKDNAAADALTCWEQETDLQNDLKAEYWTRSFLSKDQVDPDVLKDLSIELNSFDLTPLEEEQWNEDLTLVEKIFQANHTSESLKAVRAQAEREVNGDFTLDNRVLMYDDQVVMLTDGNL